MLVLAFVFGAGAVGLTAGLVSVVKVKIQYIIHPTTYILLTFLFFILCFWIGPHLAHLQLYCWLPTEQVQ
jgi:hypothetical protein